MSAQLHALVADGTAVSSRERAELENIARAAMLPGTVVVTTCQRVELYGLERDLVRFAADGPWAPMRSHQGPAVARHLIRLAVGLESTVVGEDQVLHQLRTALRSARSATDLPADIDRLFDMALRAGRTARSWLPARRGTLADAVLDQVGATRGGPASAVLVIGAGEVGRLMAAALTARGLQALIGSRTPERARSLAAMFGARWVPFVPSPEAIAQADGLVIALSGPWPLDGDSRAALLASTAWVADLSSPPAIDDSLRSALAHRLTTIDDLVASATTLSSNLIARLDELVEATFVEYTSWAAAAEQRTTADAIRSRAAELASVELEQLWRRAPRLSPAEREEIAHALRRVTDGLLRDPLERLGDDADRRDAQAAARLFRL